MQLTAAMTSPGATSRFIPLRLRLTAIICLLLLAFLAVLALLLSRFQSQTIREQLELRGLSIARSLAATSISDLVTYNYVALEQAANQAARDTGIVYVIIHDKEGRVAGISGRPELQNTALQDALTEAALEADTPRIQTTHEASDRVPALDIALPVTIAESGGRWGTIRVGMSLLPMYQQIRQIHSIIAIVGVIALILGTIASFILARRITSPLSSLAAASRKAAQGDLNQDISIHTRDEVEILASNFSHMIRELLAHRQQLEHQLEEISRLQRYREKLMTTMADGLLSVDVQGTIMTVNPEAVKILGIDSQVRRIFELPPECAGLVTHIRAILENPLPRTSREIVLKRDEESAFILTSSSILSDQNGNLQEIILTLHDVTGLKLLEAKVRQAERLAALGTLAAGLAHEIRNPLSAIKTFVQLLPRKVERPDFLQKFQRTVPREITRINDLVENLLELARVPKYAFKHISLADLIQRVVDLIEEEFTRSGIAVQVRIPEALPPIWADPDQLIKAFQNLAVNAQHAMSGGGRLEIEAYTGKSGEGDLVEGGDQDWVSVVFQDTGTGIRENLRKNIFNPFFTTKDKGTGLGLAITHKVVTEHGGQIELVEGTGGARFVILLPTSKNRPESDQE